MEMYQRKIEPHLFDGKILVNEEERVLAVTLISKREQSLESVERAFRSGMKMFIELKPKDK